MRKSFVIALAGVEGIMGNVDAGDAGVVAAEGILLFFERINKT